MPPFANLSRSSKALLIYGALLALSSCFRFLLAPAEAPPGTIHASEYGGVRAGEAVPTLLLLHGSTTDAEDMQPLAQALEQQLSSSRILVVDLPGFGESGPAIGSLAAQAQAQRLAPFLDSAGIQSLHIIGYGYGGAVALNLAALLGERVESLALISTAAAPAVNLLGDPALNRAVVAGQYAALWLARAALPHFGFLDRSPVGPAYAQAQLDTDLRASQRAFERWAGPMLILAADKDPALTPTALEIYRRTRPSAVIHRLASEREEVLQEGVAELAGRYRQFLSAAADWSESQGTRSPPGGFKAAGSVGLDPWLGGLLLALATFGSEDLACIGGGLLAARGSISLAVATTGCLLGIFLGDMGIYLIGRFFGLSALRLPILRRLATPLKLQRAARWFERKGLSLVVMTRFFPGSRVPTYFAAGVVKASAVRFALALLVAAAVWTPLLVGLSYLVGDRFLTGFENLGALGWVGVALTALGFLLLSRLGTQMLTWRGRRLLYSRYRRLLEWEFWPVWALYPPVLLYIGWLMLRYRSVTLPTAVNPFMLAGGLVFESKGDILAHLQAAGAPVAPFARAPLTASLEEKERILADFLQERGLNFPVALKPDVGQRGQGVVIARSAAEAAAFFQEQREDSIIQQYVGGREYGVFYERSRHQRHGQVTSVTDKRFIEVAGDGRLTLETLILRDRRAVRMARYFLSRLEQRLDEVIPTGEVVQLATVGTHARGALFLDGAALITPALVAEVDAFSRVVPDFHFGRYDIKAPSEEAFKRGEGLSIIELNGLTSEPTAMYDPEHSVWHAWRLLIKHWRRIFELAQENRLAGCETESLSLIARLAWAHIRGAPLPRDLVSRTPPPRRRSSI